MLHRLMISKENKKPDLVYYMNPCSSTITSLSISDIEYGELCEDESIELNVIYKYTYNSGVIRYSFDAVFSQYLNTVFNGFKYKQLIIHEYPNAAYFFVGDLKEDLKEKLINILKNEELINYISIKNEYSNTIYNNNDINNRICFCIDSAHYSHSIFQKIYSILHSCFPTKYTEREIGYMCPVCFSTVDKKTKIKEPENNINDAHIILQGVYEGKCKECKALTEFIEIDYNILDIISLANKNGIKTVYCCEGHGPNNNTYIMFRMSEDNYKKYVVCGDYKGDALSDEFKELILGLFEFSYNELNGAYVISSIKTKKRKKNKKLDNKYIGMEYGELKQLMLKTLKDYISLIISEKK